MKVICIKSKTFDYFSNYGGTQLNVEKGKIYECLKNNFGYNIQDENKFSLYYPIVIDFNEFFMELKEYRRQKINKIL